METHQPAPLPGHPTPVSYGVPERAGATLESYEKTDAMTRYWVVGGEYADMKFAEIAPGAALERHGPFDTYQDARRKWQTLAWATVDSCRTRYCITEESHLSESADTKGR